MSDDRKPQGERPDVHAAIREAAAILKASKRAGFRNADEFPEVSALLHAGRDAVAATVPRSLEFEGRTYWLRVRLAAQVDIFDAPGDAVPLVSGMSFSTTDHGHAPGH